MENFLFNDPLSCVSTWFSVSQGNFTITNSIFDHGNFIQILSASAGNISIFDCQIINSIFSQVGFYFSIGGLFASFINVTFFNNSLMDSFIHFENTENSSIIISSLNFSNNMPINTTIFVELSLYFHYIYISSGQNNTISFQNFMVFENSNSSNIYFSKIAYN